MMTDFENQFQREFLETVPKTSIEYVVQVFLRCIEDTDLVGKYFFWKNNCDIK